MFEVQPGPSTSSICVEFNYTDDSPSATYPYPCGDVEKLTCPMDSDEFYPDTFRIGDVVEAQYQDGKFPGKWYRGRVVDASEDIDCCDIIYYDGDVSRPFVDGPSEGASILHVCALPP